MKQMRTRIFSVLLSLAMMLSLLPATALAASTASCPGGTACNHVAAIGDTHYDTLAEAVDAVQNNETIELLKTTEGSGVKVIGTSERTFTIDLNGYTYTVVDPTVGSSGTETNCFQLLKGSTVTFKDGTLKSGTTNARILLQNYCNLTLDNVTVDCSGSTCEYVASNNCGNVVIRNSTLIAADGQCAFDLYYWPSNGYAEGVTVTVEGDSSITGKIEYGSDGTSSGLENVAEKAVLNIKGGTFTGSFYTYALGTEGANINITGGTFSTDVSAYVGDDYICSQNSDGTYSVLEPGAQNAYVSVTTESGETSYYKTLTAAVNAAQSGSTVKLLKDIVVSQSNTIPEGKTLVVDLNGKAVTVTESFSGRIFTNNGTLTIQGNGSVDVSNAGANGYGTVNNFGTLTVVGGTYTNPKESDASNFYNRSGGTATFQNPTIYGGGGCVATEANTTTTINGGYYEDATYPAIENRGNMLITAGTFVNTSCSSCDGRWGYTIRSGISSSSAYLKIQGASEDSVQVTGVQGGLAVVGGTADIYNGVYKTVPCEVHPSGSSAFYAGYFTGESYETSTNIYGGTFESCSKTAILVGNGNPAPDSGAGEKSTVMIYGGGFTGGDAAKTAITVNKVEYAIGAAKIFGGYFTSDPSAYVAEGKAAVTSDNGDYAFMVADKADDVLAAPATGEPVLDTSSLPSDMSAADKEAVTNAAAKVTDRGELAAAANVAVGNVTEAEKDAAVKAYEDSGLAGENVTIYAQTYLDITPTAYNAGSDLTLEIKPMYRVVASTATSADQIDLEGAEKNAVVLENSEKELTGVQNMTISITLPTGFPTVNLYVKHTKDGQFVAYHATTVSGSTLTFTNDKGFSTFEIAADSRTATVDFGGTSVTLTPADIGKNLPTGTAPSGQVFGGWTFKDVEGATGTYTTLTDELLTALNGKTVTATAYCYTPSSGTTYAVTVEKAENGKVSVSSTRAAKGSTVTVTVTPDEGYALSQLTITDGSGKAVAATKVSDTKYTFKMPASKVTVKAVFEKAEVVSTLPFTDVSGNAWYYEAVKYAYEAGMMNGTSETKFSPDNNLTRGMIVTILYRQAGSPAVTSDGATWWSDARVWAMENGVSDGTNMDKPITREQLATMLYRYAGNPTTKGSLENFTDASSVSAYAETAMKWAVENGIITGVTDTTLKPQGTATRAQSAAMLMRFVETIQ